MEESEKIKQLNTEAEGVVAEIRTKHNEIAALIGELKGFNQEGKTVIEQIKVKNTSADTKLQSIETKLNNIVSSESSSATLLQQIQSKVTESETLTQRLVELKAKIEDGSTGVEATLTQIAAKNTTTSEKLTEAESLVKQITDFTSTASRLDSEIKSYKEQVDGYIKEIEKMYSYINGSGLSHSFTERQKELEDGVFFWRKATFLSVLILAVVLYYLIKNPIAISGAWYELFLYKVTYSSPFIFLVWFSALQYSRAQRLMDSYAFKAATAKALENYTEVLERRFGDVVYKKDILEFVLASMKNIYQHPNKDEISKEDKELEKNALAHIGSALKDVGVKVIDPVNNLLEKIKGLNPKE